MKKFSSLLIGFILGFLVCYFFICNNADYTSDIDKVTDTDAMVEKIAPNPPKGLIDSETAEAMSKAYNPRQKVVSTLIGQDDNVSSWYSLDDLNAYLAFAEIEAKEKGYTMNGIRLYLGVHPPITPDTKNLTTLFMVSTGTRNKSEGSIVDMSFLQGSGDDIPGGSGLDMGGDGNPPNKNYPQN
jgi:hypothetical protein